MKGSENMQITKEACIARAKQWGHKDGGIVIKAIEASFDPKLPKGTNRMLKFYEGLLGHPYGATDKCIDKKTDCAEMTRVGYWVYIGRDIGNFTDAQYKNKTGVVVTEDFNALPKCRPTDLVFYKTSSTKKTGHVSVIYDSKHIIHSGASENGKKVGFSAITWGKKYWKKGMCAKRFITDEEYQALIVGGIEKEAETQYWRLLKNKGVPYLNGPDVLRVQAKLKELGYFKGSLGGNYGPITEAAVIEFQRAMKLAVDGIVGPKTWAALFGEKAKEKPAVVVKWTRMLKNTGKPYMRGDDVLAVQEALVAKGYDPGEIDGIYGPQTEDAVRKFQKDHGLEVDGIVGKETTAALGLKWGG